MKDGSKEESLRMAHWKLRQHTDSGNKHLVTRGEAVGRDKLGVWDWQMLAGIWVSQVVLVVKNLPKAGDPGSTPGSGRSLGGGHGNPFQYSCLENPMDRGARRATVQGVAKSRTRLKWLSHACLPLVYIRQMNNKAVPAASLVPQLLRICLPRRRPGFDPWVGKIPWRRAWPPTPVFLPGNPYGQRSLTGYSPQGLKELNTTQRLSTAPYSTGNYIRYPMIMEENVEKNIYA